MVAKKQRSKTGKVKSGTDKSKWDQRGLQWADNIDRYRAGDKSVEKWMYSNLYNMYATLTDNEDYIQELMIHFFRKVLPAIDTSWYPIPIIYTSAKRILINLYNRYKKFDKEFLASHTEYLDSVQTDISGNGEMLRTALSGELRIDGDGFIMSDAMAEYSSLYSSIAGDKSASQELQTFALCRFNFPTIRCIYPDISKQAIIDAIMHYAEETNAGRKK